MCETNDDCVVRLVTCSSRMSLHSVRYVCSRCLDELFVFLDPQAKKVRIPDIGYSLFMMQLPVTDSSNPVTKKRHKKPLKCH